MFGNEPVKRKERPKIEKKSPNVSTSIIDLDDSMDLNISLIADNAEKQESLKRKAAKTPEKKPEVRRSNEKKVAEAKISPKHLKSNLVTPKKEVKTEDKSPAKALTRSSSAKKSDVKKHVTPKSRSPSPKKVKLTKPTSSKKEKTPKVTTAEEDQERHERKQMSAMLYQKFKNRSSVLNHGCKEIPKGKPDCLKHFHVVITGILESMERDEAVDLIKSCGGAVVSGLSKKVTHLLVGEEAGPSKLEKAKGMKIRVIDEDELLRIIRKNSGLPDAPSTSLQKDDEVAVVKDSPGKENRVKNDEADVKKEIKSPAADKKKPATQVSQPAPLSAPISAPQNLDHFSFVDKYKPTSIKQIIGQQGLSGNAQKLMNWLSKWHVNNDGKKKHTKPNPWAKDNDGSAFKAALLSGSPGVGKTTTAHLVAQDLLFDIVEFNASDTRSKRLLKEEVSALLSNKSLAGYLTGAESKVSTRHVLIMDEVDGMAGNEDRGGVAELVALIKESRVPIICMCNDRNHPKIRSLSNYCYDLRFHKPSTQQIRGAMMSISFKEGLKLEASAMDEIIGGTGNDIRQTLNHLALYSASKDVKLSTADAKKNAQSSEKDTKIVSL